MDLVITLALATVGAMYLAYAALRLLWALITMVVTGDDGHDSSARHPERDRSTNVR